MPPVDGAPGSPAGLRTASRTASLAAADPRAASDPVEAAQSAAMAMLVEADPQTADHSDDVVLVCAELCDRLGMSAEDKQAVLVAARLHDVGKVAVPREILNKPGPLSDSEWKAIKQHTIVGERILRATPALAPAAELVRHSHERFDGGGYPDGLAGEQIPLGSRIIFCADAFHAIRSDRPYRAGRTAVAALAEMRANAGRQFDPAVVDALQSLMASARGSMLRQRAPKRLLALLLTLAFGTTGAYAAERGWIDAPLPGINGDSTERHAPTWQSSAGSGDSGQTIREPNRRNSARGESGDRKGKRNRTANDQRGGGRSGKPSSGTGTGAAGAGSSSPQAGASQPGAGPGAGPGSAQGTESGPAGAGGAGGASGTSPGPSAGKPPASSHAGGPHGGNPPGRSGTAGENGKAPTTPAGPPSSPAPPPGGNGPQGGPPPHASGPAAQSPPSGKGDASNATPSDQQPSKPTGASPGSGHGPKA